MKMLLINSAFIIISSSSMSFVDSHGHALWLVVQVEFPRLQYLLVDEGGLAGRACALCTFVIHFVETESLSETT